MAIWFKSYSLDEINARGEGTMSAFLGIEFRQITEDSLVATMPVTVRSRQPLGILHGGANVVLAETLASTAANLVVDISKQYCVGLEINANHLRSVREGEVEAVTRPIHLGKSTQVWEIQIYTAEKKISCISRMTAAVLNR
ncbi:MAG: hotdog fold thioesterase [Legionellaceae bacterium]|nr:hotdog fold thioesterase [Legionellaceae bacterium]